MFELVSEINLVGEVVEIGYNFTDGIAPADTSTWWKYSYAYTTSSPYFQDASHRLNTYLWQKEMAKYIKHDLEHKQHILTCSYAGGPGEGDATYSIPELDIISVNKYGFGNLNNMNSLQSFVSNLHQEYNKPVIFSESGPLDEMYCSGTYSYTQQLWQLPFTGVAGFNYWDADRVNSAPEWAEMKKLKDWILNDPLKKSILLGNWKMGHGNGTERGTVHKYWRKDLNFIYESTPSAPNSPGTNPFLYKVFGSLINLTDNYFTNNVKDSSWCLAWGNKNQWMKDRLQTESNGISEVNRLSVKNDLSTNTDPMLYPWGGYSQYTAFGFASELTWYDLASFDSIPGNWLTASAPNVPNPLPHPTMYITDDNIAIYGKRSILPFEGLFTNWLNSSMTQSNGATQAFSVLKENNRLEIQTLTNSNQYVVDEQRDTTYEIYITNLMGQIIYSGNIDLNTQNGIFTENFPTGILIVTLINANEKHTVRWLNL